MTDQWLSIIEYARFYNISDMTVRRRIKNGKLHAILKEGKYYIPTSDKSKMEENRRNNLNASNQTTRGDLGPFTNTAEIQMSTDHHQKVSNQNESNFGAKYRQHQIVTPESRHPLNEKDDFFSQSDSSRQSFNSYGNYPSRNVDSTYKKKQYNLIPKTITSSIEPEVHIGVKTERLLEFCNSTIENFEKMKEVLEENYKLQAKSLLDRSTLLEAKITEKNQKIDNLSQKIEDLQLLITILESSLSKVS